MPKIYKGQYIQGVFIPLEETRCRPFPSLEIQDPIAAAGANRCFPGVPYEVVVEYADSLPSPARMGDAVFTVWLGLKPSKSGQDNLDWILLKVGDCDPIGIYQSFAGNTETLVEET